MNISTIKDPASFALQRHKFIYRASVDDHNFTGRLTYARNKLIIEKYDLVWIPVAEFTASVHIRRVQVVGDKPRILFEYTDPYDSYIVHTTVIERNESDRWEKVMRFCDSRMVSCPYSKSILSASGNVLLYSNTKEGHFEKGLASGRLTWIDKNNKGFLSVESSLPLGLGAAMDINLKEDTIVVTSVRTKPETGNRIFLFKKDENGFFRMRREIEDPHPKHSEELTISAWFDPHTDELIIKRRHAFL